jgi:hypothetical protein
MGLFGLHLPKKVDNVIGGIGRQINPLDHGATFSNPQPQIQQPQMQQPQMQAPHPSLFSRIDQAPRGLIGAGLHTLGQAPGIHSIGSFGSSLIHPILQADKSIIDGVQQVAKAPSSLVRLPAANLTHNLPARNAAINDLTGAQHAVGGLLQSPGQAMTTLISGANQHFRPNSPDTTTFHGGVGGFLAGNQPIPTLQAANRAIKQQSGTPAAVTNTVLTGLTALPILKGAKTASFEGVRGAKAAVKYDRAQNEKGFVGSDGKENDHSFTKTGTGWRVHDPNGMSLGGVIKYGDGRWGSAEDKTQYKTRNEAAQALINRKTNDLVGRPIPPGTVVSQDLVGRGSTPSSIKAVKPTQEELQMGKALGMSAEQVTNAKATMNDGGLTDIPESSVPRKATYKGKVIKPSVVDGKVTEVPDSMTPIPPLNDAPVNTARNPFKIDIPEVKPGDWQQARINPQIASHHVNFAAGQLYKAIRSLPEKERDVRTFFTAVEDPTNPNHSPAMKEAISRYRELDNRIHGTSQALGGNTNYLNEHALHPWDLPEEFTQGVNGAGQDFTGLNSVARKYRTIAEGEKAGLKLTQDPLEQVLGRYVNGSSNALRRQALIKGFAEADKENKVQPHMFDAGANKTIPLSNDAIKQIKAYVKTPEVGKLHSGYRLVNRGGKQVLLSVSEFHPNNIALKAVPTMIGRGHFKEAAKGLYDTYRAQIGRKYSDNLQQNALQDGTVEFGARIGSPPKFGSDYTAEGKLSIGHAGLGEKTIFEKAMPALHIQMLKAAKADLDKKNLSYDSPEAHKLGNAVNEIMGFVNLEVRNLDPRTQRAFSDVALAPQFTRSKWNTLRRAFTEKGLSGSYARRAVVGNYAAQFVAAAALGALYHQQSDSVTDLLTRTLIHPSVPTPLKDSKGNNIELGMPSNYLSEAAGLVGNLDRKNGRLGVNVDPRKVPGNLATYGRSRLAIIPGSGLKLATNTNFADKPLYDKNAPGGQQVEQAATTLGMGLLPIGAQGAAQTKFVKDHAPGAVKEVLDANTPGSNPVIKSVGSSFGLTPRTDKTVGKGLETTAYFGALDKAKQGLNRQEKDAIDLYSGSKKNPVTGKLDVTPNPNDQRAKAATLLQNTKVIDHLISMNADLAKRGQKVDPLWNQGKDKITKVLQYQAMPPHGPDQADWHNKNDGWYKDLQKSRSDFFDSLPKNNSQKVNNPIEYPTPDANTKSLLDKYFKLPSGADRGAFMRNNPEVEMQFQKQDDYYNKVRDAQGYSKNKVYPKAVKPVQDFMDNYFKADKAGRKNLRTAYPGMYQSSMAYLDNVDMYNINKQGAVNALQGEPDYNDAEAKAIAGLAKDVVKNGDGSYTIVPAAWMSGLGGGSSGSGSGYGSSGYRKLGGNKGLNPAKYLAPIGVKQAPKFGKANVQEVKVKPRQNRGVNKNALTIRKGKGAV